MPNVYVIAGPNGAGKTTFARVFLPMVECDQFVNADLIAQGLAPLKPASADYRAGEIMLQELDRHLQNKKDFAFECTLSGRAHLKYLSRARQLGFSLHLIYLWLPLARMAIERVHLRVKRGGHSVPDEVIERRYRQGIHHLFNLYLPLVDSWALYDNSQQPVSMIAQGHQETKEIVDIMRYRAMQAMVMR